MSKPWIRYGYFIMMLLLGLQRAESSEPTIAYGTSDWPVKGLGNIRAHLAVSNRADAVWIHVPWRRRDENPQNKETILIDAASGLRVTNLIRITLSRSSGDLLFQPPTVPGEYYLYYLPYQTAGEWYFPTTLYSPPTNTMDPAWAANCQDLAERIKHGKSEGIPRAQLLEIQSVNQFHRFDPMEIIAAPDEVGEFLGRHGRRPFLLFPEDRLHAIRMRDDLPLRWVQAGPSQLFEGEACQGEFYPFQIGLYASHLNLKKLTATWSDLVSSDGAVIPATAIRCFNLAGTNWLGQAIQKNVDVPAGKIQALWFGLAVPSNAPAKTYLGSLHLAAKDTTPQHVDLRISVINQALADGGDADPERGSRLRWLDSTIGLDDEVFPPYTPMILENRTISILGRKLRFDHTGLPSSIISTFTRNVDGVDAPPQELLAAPIDLRLEADSGLLPYQGAGSRILQQSSGAIRWLAQGSAGPLRVECRAKMECDGYVNYTLLLQSTQAVDLKNVSLEIPLRREMATYMMGMGRKGGYRPTRWQWKWDRSRSNNQLWIGDINAGLSCKLKHLEDRWDLYNLQQSGTYRDWSRDGEGGCNVEEEGDRVVIRAYTGPRTMAAGETLHFNFGLLITPLKRLDGEHWGWRYFHRGNSSPIQEIADTGATIVNIHQGDALNPYINYPFLTTEELSNYTIQAHARKMKVKLYYTIRELSNFTREFWALRSLGDEVFTDGPGFRLADHFQANQPSQGLPNTGDSWLCEHAVSGYVPAWHTPLGNGRIDAAIATAGLSRWHNYYLEGLCWLIRHVGIDGLYLDGVGYDREIMKRVRKVMQRSRPGCLIDFHSGNNFHPEYGLNNCANQYLELFPYVDSLWFGEGFDYDESPDYWLVEMAGIPYGLFGEMLQGGGNPWRGMLFGMTSRLGWGGDPREIWKLWDAFGIAESRMQGFWDTNCPARTDHPAVLTTTYIRSDRTLISLASWATNDVRVKVKLDTTATGLDPARISFYAPAIPGFQSETLFRRDDLIPFKPGRGWLLWVDEKERPTPQLPGGK